MNKMNAEAKQTMRTRIITAVVIFVLAVPAVIVGGWFFAALIFVGAIFAIHEIINAVKHNSYPLALHIFVYVMTLSLIFWIFMRHNIEYIQSLNETLGPEDTPIFIFDLTKWSFSSGFEDVQISTMGVTSTLFTLFVFAIFSKNFKMTDVTYLFTMMIFLGVSLQSLLFLRYYPQYNFFVTGGEYQPNVIQSGLLIVYVFLGVTTTDVGAYFIGVLFGKHKMNSRISPKKTWEGFFGGIIASFIISFTFGYLIAFFKMPMLTFLTVDKWYWILLLSILIPIIATLGDFVFSAIKRHFEIKDFGTLFPGHGGVLDRIDSLLCTSLAVTVIIVLMANGWKLV
ncbi:MAG: phosphatidate cytidylyltransferase [Bacilli bacterium]|jgi:phosphatidate cytidylyltransferase|nr:phosphatidate cytidylyltransferase [Bacilli bacterium]